MPERLRFPIVSLSVSRRTWVIGGAVAAAVLAAMLIVVLTAVGDDGADVRLSAPRYVADPVPVARTIPAGDVPERCGVRKTTIHRYAPGDESEYGDEQCEWYSLNHGRKRCPGFCRTVGGDRERILEITFTTQSSSGTGDSPGGYARHALDPADASLAITGRPARPVGGLGDEALYRYSPALSSGGETSGGSSLRFRVSGTVVTVTYRGRDFSGSGPSRQIAQVAEKAARPAVFAAAADVAAALHVPAKPAFTAAAAAGPSPVRTMPRPCDLVPRALVDRLTPEATRQRPQSYPPLNTSVQTYGLAGDGCQWDSAQTYGGSGEHRPERHLTVTVLAARESRPGIAVPQATRQYLERHDDVRAEAGAGLRAVRGLGDQAYAAYRGQATGTDAAGGEVTFRYRNLVVQVVYSGGIEDRLERQAAVDGAYTVATRVQEAMR